MSETSKATRGRIEETLASDHMAEARIRMKADDHELRYLRAEVERLTAERDAETARAERHLGVAVRGQEAHNALKADRDAQVREAFMAGRTARRVDPVWFFPPLSVMTDEFQQDSEAAFAAFQARPSSGTGSGEKEQS